jgi:hypothetical protein
MKKKCIICKKEFNLIVGNQKCCSKECSKINYKNYMNTFNHSEKNKICQKNYWSSKNGKIVQKRFRKSDKNKLNQSKYQKSEVGKRTIKKYNKSYHQTKKYLTYQEKYRLSPRGKEIQKNYRLSPLGRKTLQTLAHKRRERENNCIHNFTNQEWKLKCEETKGICPHCHKPFDNKLHVISLDHIFALYWANIYFKQTGKKFIYTIDKVMPLCLSCNKKKGNKLIWEFN